MRRISPSYFLRLFASWKKYFFDFSMISLAVILGFYAENLRESMKEKAEIKDNMKSLLSDLVSDVDQFDRALEINTYGYKCADALVSLLGNEITNTNAIYYNARAVTANICFFYANTKTFEQIKSAGMLKLIESEELLHTVGTYYSNFQLLENIDIAVRLKQDNVHRGNGALFDAYAFSQMQVKYDNVNRVHTEIMAPTNHPPLISTDPKTVNEVALNNYYLGAALKFDCSAAERQRTLAQKLIASIKAQYGF